MTTDFVAYDDLPRADEESLRARASELIALAEGLGLTNLRYASSNRIVVTLTEHVETFGEYRFAEKASYLLGLQVRVYDDAVLKTGRQPGPAGGNAAVGLGGWIARTRARSCWSRSSPQPAGCASSAPAGTCGASPMTRSSASHWRTCGCGLRNPRVNSSRGAWSGRCRWPSGLAYAPSETPPRARTRRGHQLPAAVGQCARRGRGRRLARRIGCWLRPEGVRRRSARPAAI